MKLLLVVLLSFLAGFIAGGLVKDWQVSFEQGDDGDNKGRH